MPVQRYAGDRFGWDSPADIKPTGVLQHAFGTELSTRSAWILSGNQWLQITGGIGTSTGTSLPATGNFIVFQNVNEMLNYSPPNHGNAGRLLGYYNPDDGGGGPIYWDNFSTETQNSGTIFTSNLISTGRWKRPRTSEISVLKFGAKGLGTSGDHDEITIQNTIDYCRAGTISTGSYSILFPQGRIFYINEPLIIANKKATNDGYDFVYNIELKGDGDPIFSHVSTIKTAYSHKPAIIIQHGRCIQIRNLCLQGTNTFDTEHDFSNSNDIYDDTSYFSSVNHPRDNQWSPYAAICTDPFSSDSTLTGANIGNQYPDLSGYYVGNTNGGSRRLTFEKLSINNFLVGVMLNPNPNNRQGDDTIIEDCHIYACTYGVSVGQDQTRNVWIRNGSIVLCNIGVTCFQHGNRIGTAPHIIGGDYGTLKHFVQLGTSRGQVNIIGVYGEQMRSLGFLHGGPFPVNFIGCSFDFNLGTINEKITEYHLLSPATPVNFDGCEFTIYGNTYGQSPLIFYSTDQAVDNFSKITFNGCNFYTPLYGSPNLQATQIFSNNPQHLIFNNCSHFMEGSKNELSQIINVDSVSNWNKTKTTFGGFISSNNSIYHISENSPACTFDISNLILDGNGNGTYVTPQYYLLCSGDYLTTQANDLSFQTGNNTGIASGIRYTISPYGYTSTYHGRVSGISGQTITVTNIPKNITGSGNWYPNKLKWWPQLHEPSYGYLTQGSNLVTGVTNASTIWSVRNRIRTANSEISNGVWVSGLSGSNALILSTAANSTVGPILLYDVDIRTITLNEYAQITSGRLSGITYFASSGINHFDTLSGFFPVATDPSGNLTSTGIIGIQHGGTNATTANTALNNLLPSQASQNGKFLQTDGSNTLWVNVSGTSSNLITGYTSSGVAFFDANGTLTGNARRFFWDNTGTNLTIESTGIKHALRISQPNIASNYPVTKIQSSGNNIGFLLEDLSRVNTENPLFYIRSQSNGGIGQWTLGNSTRSGDAISGFSDSISIFSNNNTVLIGTGTTNLGFQLGVFSTNGTDGLMLFGTDTHSQSVSTHFNPNSFYIQNFAGGILHYSLLGFTTVSFNNIQAYSNVFLINTGFQAKGDHYFYENSNIYLNSGSNANPNDFQGKWSSSNGQLIARRQILDKNTDYSLNHYESRSAITNSGAAGEIKITLPPAYMGVEYIGIVESNQLMRIMVSNSGTIRIGNSVSSNTGCASSNRKGDVLHLLGVNTGEWYAISEVGTWTLE